MGIRVRPALWQVGLASIHRGEPGDHPAALFMTKLAGATAAP